MNYIGNKMRPGVSLGVLGYPGVSWGNQTDPTLTHLLERSRNKESQLSL